MKGDILKNLFVVFIILLSACTSTADIADQMIDLGTIKTTKETFDGSTTVIASPHRLYDPDRSMWSTSLNNFFLGARWNSKHEDTVVLTIEHRGSTSSETIYLSVRNININIDGDITSYTTNKSTILSNGGYNTITRTIYTRSRNSVVVSLNTLNEMVSAKDCRLRIHTSKGYQDFIFSVDRIPGGSGASRMSIRKFLSVIKEL